MVLTHCPYVGELWLHHFSMLLLCTGLKYLTKSFCHLLLQYSAKQAVMGLLVQDAAKKFCVSGTRRGRNLHYPMD